MTKKSKSNHQLSDAEQQRIEHLQNKIENTRNGAGVTDDMKAYSRKSGDTTETVITGMSHEDMVNSWRKQVKTIIDEIDDGVLLGFPEGISGGLVCAMSGSPFIGKTDVESSKEEAKRTTMLIRTIPYIIACKLATPQLMALEESVVKNGGKLDDEDKELLDGIASVLIRGQAMYSEGCFEALDDVFENDKAKEVVGKYWKEAMRKTMMDIAIHLDGADISKFESVAPSESRDITGDPMDNTDWEEFNK